MKSDSFDIVATGHIQKIFHINKHFIIKTHVEKEIYIYFIKLYIFI